MHAGTRRLKKFKTHKWHGRYASLRRLIGRLEEGSAANTLDDALFVDRIFAVSGLD